MKALAAFALLASSAAAASSAAIPAQIHEAFALAEGMKMAVAD